jgi:hypothetical protein
MQVLAKVYQLLLSLQQNTPGKPTSYLDDQNVPRETILLEVTEATYKPINAIDTESSTWLVIRFIFWKKLDSLTLPS